MKKNRKATTFLKQKSYLLAAVLMLTAVFGMMGVYVSEQKSEKKLQEQQAAAQKEQEEQMQQAAAEQREKEQKTTQVDQVIPSQNDDFLDEPAVVSSEEDTKGVTPEETVPEETPPAAAQETTSSKVQTQLHFNAVDEMNWPLQGNVIMNYSMDQTIYFATLDQYKYNPALIIQGNVNDKVLSVADGKVTGIETTAETGCTVTIELGDGYSAIYGQLKEVPLKTGDYLNAGDIVGYVNEPTKYYSLEGPNLYFEMTKDNESLDPMEFLQ